MHLRVLIATSMLACIPLACTDDGGTSETTSDAETTGTTGDAGTTETGDAGTTETGDGDGDGDTTDTSETETGDGDGDPNGPNCDDPWAMICEFTGGMMAGQVDCGLVTEADDLAAWQAAHQCALDAVDMQVGFKVVGQAFGIDSLLSSAYGGLAGESYQLLTFLHDNWSPTANYAECVDIDKEPGCKVEVGDLCLRCVDATDPVEICN